MKIQIMTMLEHDESISIMKGKNENQGLAIVAACHILNHQTTIIPPNVQDQQVPGFLGQQGRFLYGLNLNF